ncbi:MAG: 50S ribosomal protein L35 [Candidatus Marinimicrobia bacterium]|jgi:large subunit ribosomal protein L35|nr:50S ribosomal protein L35 [Candidatus Neomarinimicrobiota bacterium]
MPKMKTRRSAAKRFSLTGTGKVKRNKAYHSHILTSKSSKRKRILGQATIAAPSDVQRIKKMIIS